MMDNSVFVRTYIGDDDSFAVNRKEVFRYAGYGGLTDTKDEQIEKLLNEVIAECNEDLSYKVCYRQMELRWENSVPVLPFRTDSKNLAKCLEGSSKVVIFAATIGLGIDRKISRNRLLSPTKALLMQAYGAERVEKLCDVFCSEIGNEAAREGMFCTPRFSPGYGDLPLETQKDVFRLLECNIKIGISLNRSLLMTPSKSVTAIFGLREKNRAKSGNKCELCSKTDCLFRDTQTKEECHEST